MKRDELLQMLRHSEDVQAYATAEEIRIVCSNESVWDQFVAVLNEVESAPGLLPPTLRGLLLHACEVIDALLPLRPLSPTSVSAILACARRCVAEGVT